MGGSSGAPVFNENKKIVGQHTAVSSEECPSEPNQFIGRFDKSWNIGNPLPLKNFLDINSSDPQSILGNFSLGWLHTEIGNSNASNNDKVDDHFKSIAVGAGNQVFYRGNNNHVQTFFLSSVTNTFQHGNLGGTSPQNSQKIKGDIVVGAGNQVFYRGNNGHIHTYYWSNNTWNHDDLSSLVSNSNNTHKISSKEGSLAIGMNNQLFYRGTDDRVQTYYWSSTNGWQHGHLESPTAPSSHNVDGDLEVAPNPNNNNRVIYRGVNGKINQYTWNGNSWVHGFMAANHQVSSEAGSIVVGITGQIFFRGTDNKMQTFYTNNGSWTHDWLGLNTPQAKIAGDIAIGIDNKLFYTGTDAHMHSWYWSNNTWIHDWLESSHQAPSIHNTNGSIAVGIATGSSHVFYRGQDDRMKRYHWEKGELKSTNLQNGYYSIRETELSPTIPNIDYTNNLLNLIVRPNPIKDIFVMDVYAQSDSEGQILIYNGIGQLVVGEMVKMNKGTNSLQLNIGHLNNGIYHLSVIDSNGGNLTKSIIKI